MVEITKLHKIRAVWGVENQRVLPNYVTMIFFICAFVLTAIICFLYITQVRADNLQFSVVANERAVANVVPQPIGR